MMFMPKLPDDPKLDVILNDNLMVGEQIKSLIDEGKIELGKFDKDFRLNVKVL